MIRIGIVAGEASGDRLGADLIRALKKRYPQAIFEGIGGNAMVAEGFNTFYPLSCLSVMGLWEPIKRLPLLLKIRSFLKKHFVKNRPDIFIGIDSPDFNLGLAQFFKSHGIKTAHYVSPTIWAWRSGRIHKIKKAVDLMLTLFPFETKIYQTHGVPVCCVGHPLADQISLNPNKDMARKSLGLTQNVKVIAILPGSREQELTYLSEPFILTAKWLHQRDPSIRFVSAMISEERKSQWITALQSMNGPEILIDNNSHRVMQASDAILVCSGTASFEAMLIKRPTVVAYKMSPITFAIAKRLVKVPYIALPNLLLNDAAMPEFVQSEVNPEKMGKILLDYLREPEKSTDIISRFENMHRELQKNAGESAANEISKVI